MGNVDHLVIFCVALFTILLNKEVVGTIVETNNSNSCKDSDAHAFFSGKFKLCSALIGAINTALNSYQLYSRICIATQ